MSKTARETAPQHARIAELQDHNGYPRLYPQNVQGKTIIGQCRRYVTREDARCIEKALYDFLMMVCGFIAEHGTVEHVYQDGMTDVEVLAAIDNLADEHRPASRAGRDRRAFQRDISAAVQLLDAHHFTIVPPGWTLTDSPEHGVADQHPDGSLARALVQLAAANGHALITPPGVDGNGQTRLL